MSDLASRTPDSSPGNKTGTVSGAHAAMHLPRQHFTLWQRVQVFFASWIGYLTVLVVGSSLRWEIHGWENWEAATKRGKGLIYTFWHREIVSACWFWRKRGIMVMSSFNFDGEYTCRIIRRHGYSAARGSSTRGGSRALLEMVERLSKGEDAAFTIDGPHGPRRVAKGGAVLLSKATGAAILCFHIAVSSAYVFHRSWDMTQLPHLFARAAIFIAPPIVVPPEADREEQARKLQEVQKTLDGLSEQGDRWVAKVHSKS